MALATRAKLCHRRGMVTVAEIGATAPRTRGRAAKPAVVSYVRELGESDIALLAGERGTAPRPIERIRDRHHALARVLAQGMTDTEASLVTGYDPSRISILKSDPGFRQLLADYHKIENAAAAAFEDRAAVLRNSAMNRLQDLVEDDEEPLGASTLLEIAKFGADRTGHAPVQKVQQTNVNIGLGARMQAARARLAPPPPVVDAEFSVVGGPTDASDG